MPISLALAETVWERSTHRGAVQLVLFALAGSANYPGDIWPPRYRFAGAGGGCSDGSPSSRIQREQTARVRGDLAPPEEIPGHNPPTAQGEARHSSSGPSSFDVEVHFQVLAALPPEQLRDRVRCHRHLVEPRADLEQEEELKPELDVEERGSIQQQGTRALQRLLGWPPAEGLHHQRQHHSSEQLAEFRGRLLQQLLQVQQHHSEQQVQLLQQRQHLREEQLLEEQQLDGQQREEQQQVEEEQQHPAARRGTPARSRGHMARCPNYPDPRPGEGKCRGRPAFH